MSSPIFYEKQNFKIVWVACLLILVFITVISFVTSSFDNNSNSVTFYISIFNFVIFIFIFFMAYDLKISIYPQKLDVKFGIGILKKTFKIEDIEPSSIGITEPSKWYGIGWRYTLDGDMIFNTRFGKAVSFSKKGSQKTYSIVSHKHEEIKDLLIELTENQHTQKQNF